jgi:hypothetical protein
VQMGFSSGGVMVLPRRGRTCPIDDCRWRSMEPGAADRWVRMVTAVAAFTPGRLTLAGMCGACEGVLLAAGAEIILMDGTGAAGLTFVSSSRVERLQDLQVTLGVGPAFDAYGEGAPIMELDLIRDPPDRWPGLVGLLIEQGIGAVFSFPLQVGAARSGAITAYRSHPGPLADDLYADALVLAAVITRAILGLQASQSDGELAAALSDGEVDGAEIHQAAGMISVQIHVAIGDALSLLRARAFAEQTTTRALAVDVVSRRIRFA